MDVAARGWGWLTGWRQGGARSGGAGGGREAGGGGAVRAVARRAVHLIVVGPKSRVARITTWNASEVAPSDATQPNPHTAPHRSHRCLVAGSARWQGVCGVRVVPERAQHRVANPSPFSSFSNQHYGLSNGTTLQPAFAQKHPMHPSPLPSRTGWRTRFWCLLPPALPLPASPRGPSPLHRSAICQPVDL